MIISLPRQSSSTKVLCLSMNTINTFNPPQLIALSPATNTFSKQPLSDNQSFAAHLNLALNKISDAQILANNQAKAFEMGEPNISLNEVMVNLQKSSVSLQFGIQVRNKLVSAYQEIMNMNV